MTDYPNNIPVKLEIIKAGEITLKKVRFSLSTQCLQKTQSIHRRIL